MAAERPVYPYREDILAECRRLGIFPTEDTPPELARNFMRDLYKFELRKLRDRYVKGEFAKRDYEKLVIEIRDRYPALALPWQLWVTS